MADDGERDDDKKASIVAKKPGQSETIRELQALSLAFRSAVEPQAQAQVEIAKTEAETQQHQITEESKLIAADQQQRHSRFKHWFWALMVFGTAFFSLASALILTGREQQGILILTHIAALVAGAFGGRALPRGKDDDDSD